MSDLAPFIETLRERLSASFVVGKTVKLKRHGHEHHGLCPFHQEKTPSFTVNDRKRFFHCFGCGAHGDIVSFLMDSQNIPFLEAVKQLADMAGLVVPQGKPMDVQAHHQKDRLYTLLEGACDFFERTLKETPVVLRYLEKRGITQDLIMKYRLGLGAQSVVEVLLKHGYIPEEIVASGIAVNTKYLTNRFHDRLIIPILDPKKRVVAFGGRALRQSQEAKYINSPETSLFHKSVTLFGQAWLGKISHEHPLYVVEGYFDVITCQAKGIHAVAPLGTALTQDHITALWRLSFEPILCFDGDAAGQKAALRACYHALSILKPGYTFKILPLPKGEDPDSFLRKNNVEDFKALSTQSLSETIFEDYHAKIKGQLPEHQAKVKKEILHALDDIQDNDVKGFYKQAFYEASHRDASTGRSHNTENLPFGKGRYTRKDPPLLKLARTQKIEKGQQNLLAEKILLATLVNHPTLIASRAEELMEYPFHIPGADVFLNMSLDMVMHENRENKDIFTHQDLSGFIYALEMDKVVRIAPFIQKSTNLDDVEKGFDHVLKRLMTSTHLRKTLEEYERKLKENFDPKIWEQLKQLQQDLLKQETIEGDI